MTQRALPDLPGVDHEYVQAGDVQIHVAIAGPADGKPVVLLHGWPENWWMWHETIPALADAGYRVYAMDLRGAGWSEVTERGYDKEQFAADVLAAADALGVNTFQLVGHDWGAWTAQIIAIRAPERVEQLGILNIAPLWVPTKDVARYVYRLFYQLGVGAPVVGPFANRNPLTWKMVGQSGMPAESVAFFKSCFQDRDRSIAGSKIYRTMVGREFLEIARGKYARDRLAMPVRVLFGLDDVVVPEVWLESFRTHADDVDIETVSGCGHFIVDERPELVNEWLLRTLAR